MKRRLCLVVCAITFAMIFFSGCAAKDPLVGTVKKELVGKWEIDKSAYSVVEIEKLTENIEFFDDNTVVWSYTTDGANWFLGNGRFSLKKDGCISVIDTANYKESDYYFSLTGEEENKTLIIADEKFKQVPAFTNVAQVADGGKEASKLPSYGNELAEKTKCKPMNYEDLRRNVDFKIFSDIYFEGTVTNVFLEGDEYQCMDVAKDNDKNKMVTVTYAYADIPLKFLVGDQISIWGYSNGQTLDNGSLDFSAEYIDLLE